MNPDASAWIAMQMSEANAFAVACRNPEATQLEILRRHLAHAAQTDFGSAHGFANIRTITEYQQAVPLQIYDSLAPWIGRSANGASDVLTPGLVRTFEETSGSGSAAKLIPCTNELRQEFERAVAAWMVALHRECPAAFAGRCYWSLSPALKPRRTTASGATVGTGNDADYFSPDAARLIGRMMAVSLDSTAVRNADEFYDATLSQLLACRDLSFISVWSPTFFLQLDRRLRESRSVARDFVWTDLWPQLAVLSCWTHAQSAMWIPEVQYRLGPGCVIQGKGLLSTEGVVSIPLTTDADPVLAIRSHFYEFLATDGAVHLPAQLCPGSDYEVVLTTGGGLYRYRTGDVVRVTGFHTAGVPQLRFMGRAGRQSDLVGEKLDEVQVNAAIEESRRETGINLSAAFVHPCAGPGYSLRVATSADDALFHSFTVAVSRSLSRNPYYAQAVRLGQLRALRCERITADVVLRLGDELRRRRAIKDGDFKFPALWKPDEVPPELQEDECLATPST